jgi:pilus assembly protein Flp/PilA
MKHSPIRSSSEDEFMRQLCQSIKTFLISEDGPTSVEYCFMLAFIFLVCVLGIGQLGATTHGLYTKSLNELP